MSQNYPPNPNQPSSPRPGYTPQPSPGYQPPAQQGPPPAQPGYGQPGYGQPGHGPGYGQPGQSQPGPGQPAPGYAGHGYPGQGQPGLGQPGYGQAPGGYRPHPSKAPNVAPQGSPYPVLVSTMNDLPGFRVDHVFGEVFGLTVRSRDFGANFTATFRSLGGGEVPEYTQMLAESRHVAVVRMCQMAQQLGANAILAMRFDCNEIAQTMSEVAAYGTAVIVRKPEPPRPRDREPSVQGQDPGVQGQDPGDSKDPDGD